MSTQNLTVNGEGWVVDTPDDISLTQVDDTTLKININAMNGDDAISFTPVNDNVDGVFKTGVQFNVTNGLDNPVNGFDLKLVTNTPAMGPLDTNDPTGHPDNYAHFHNITGNDGGPFAPLSLTTYLPDGSPDPSGLAPVISQDEIPPSELRVSGSFDPGQTVSANVATIHQTETAGQDNGFMLLFSPSVAMPAMMATDFPMMMASGDMMAGGGGGAGHLFDMSMQNMVALPDSWGG